MIKSCSQMATVLLFALLSGSLVFAQDNTTAEEPQWLLNTLKDSLTVAADDVLVFSHPFGDVRIEAADTDRIQVTAIAQYRSDDPRTPKLRFIPDESGDSNAQHVLTVDFAYLEIAENEAWAKRRIDVGLLVPEGLRLEIETVNGLIETKKVRAGAKLSSKRGNIEYKGTGDITAHTERGSIIAHLHQTGASHAVDLSTLTGDIRCIFLQGANARIKLATRGPITTDYSIAIDRESGAALKSGQVQIGRDGSVIKLTSHSGAIRLQGLIVPEKQPTP